MKIHSTSTFQDEQTQKKKTKREEFNLKKIQMHLLDSIHRKTRWDKDPYCNELCPVAVWPECIRQSP